MIPEIQLEQHLGRYITNIAVSSTGQDVILVIMCVKIFKIDVVVFTVTS
jgi:hypothetical protein